GADGGGDDHARPRRPRAHAAGHRRRVTADGSTSASAQCITNGGVITISSTRQTIPTTRRPGEIGERSSSGGLWWKPTRKKISAAHTNQFRDAAIADTASLPGADRPQRNDAHPTTTTGAPVAGAVH